MIYSSSSNGIPNWISRRDFNTANTDPFINKTYPIHRNYQRFISNQNGLKLSYLNESPNTFQTINAQLLPEEIFKGQLNNKPLNYLCFGLSARNTSIEVPWVTGELIMSKLEIRSNNKVIQIKQNDKGEFFEINSRLSF